MKPETVAAIGIGCVCAMEIANLITLGYDGTILSGCVGTIAYLCGLLHGRKKKPKKVRRRKRNVWVSQTLSFTPYPSVQSET